MQFILDILLFAVQLSPLIVLGAIISSAAYISFLHRGFRNQRLPMGAAFTIGALMFVVPLVGNSENTNAEIAWGFTESIPPFTLGGLLLYGISGLVVGFIMLTVLKRANKRKIAQFLVVGLVGTSSFLLFYYFFANRATSQTVSMLAFGLLIGVLVHVMLLPNDNLRAWLQSDE
ncbi:MAG: hypothetical protein F9K48_09920 [Candidatus Brocadia sp.]|nr:MAG: hypothetical protein F9K48_09920 [Candidatus Brocadia sp.]